MEHGPELCPPPASRRPQNSGEMEKQLLLSDAGVASYIPPAAKSSLETGEQLRDAGRGDAAQPPLPPSLQLCLSPCTDPTLPPSRRATTAGSQSCPDTGVRG